MNLCYEKNKKKILIYYHYKDLPKKGWIHNCYLCGINTSRLEIYKNYKDYDINIVICKDCKNNFKNKKYAVIDKKILKILKK